MTAGEYREIEELLELFNRLMERVVAAESAPKEFDTGVPLHRSEIHTIQAIGQSESVNVVGLARQLGVTKGAVSQMVARLQRKGLVAKRASPDDARAVSLQLTALGKKGFSAHERFHSEMHAAVFECLGGGPALSPRLASIQSALLDLIQIVEAYERRTAKH